jgi:hypothetical protein
MRSECFACAAPKQACYCHPGLKNRFAALPRGFGWTFG